MEIVARATVVFFFLLVMLRALGKRELSEMSPFDIAILVVLGDLIQQGVTQEDDSVTGAFLAAGTVIFWVGALSWVTWRSNRAHRLVQGEPIVVVHDGRVVHEAMRLERLPEDELLEAAREQGIEDLGEVRYGVLEPEGNFSFVKSSG